MYTYKLTFDNGEKFRSITENLDLTHEKIIRHIERKDLKECSILCPNGVIRRVRKTGEWHWKHNGYAFD